MNKFNSITLENELTELNNKTMDLEIASLSQTRENL